MASVSRPRCSNCGCTNNKSCPQGCCWTEKNLCCACDLFTIHEHWRSEPPTPEIVYYYPTPKPKPVP